MQQVEMICLDDLVPQNHNYRKFAKIWSFKSVEKRLKKLEKNNPYKGKDKYWYGYKQHTSVDMQSGLINKVALTPANITDSSGFKHVCPS